MDTKSTPGSFVHPEALARKEEAVATGESEEQWRQEFAEPEQAGRVCEYCSGPLPADAKAYRKYCKQECTTAAQERRYRSRKASGICTSCGVQPARPQRLQCESCANGTRGLEGDGYIRPSWPAGRERRPQPRGRYVYAWFCGDEPLPFYVGKGAGSRAWDRHRDDYGRAAFSQTQRCAAENFRVVIVRDNLTEEGSMLVEAALIRFVQQSGGLLANQRDGMGRQERPPLELENRTDV